MNRDPNDRPARPDPVAAAWLCVTTLLGSLVTAACGSSNTSPTPATPPPPAPASAALTITFSENPVPFRTTGCNASTPQGWFTSARIQETSGVTFTPTTFTQKLDGSAAGQLAESFNSRFGACSGSSFSEGVISASGAVCGVVGICSSGTFATYQFELAGTDANGHSLTFQSPTLQLGSR